MILSVLILVVSAGKNEAYFTVVHYICACWVNLHAYFLY